MPSSDDESDSDDFPPLSQSLPPLSPVVPVPEGAAAGPLSPSAVPDAEDFDFESLDWGNMPSSGQALGTPLSDLDSE